MDPGGVEPSTGQATVNSITVRAVLPQAWQTCSLLSSHLRSFLRILRALAAAAVGAVAPAVGSDLAESPAGSAAASMGAVTTPHHKAMLEIRILGGEDVIRVVAAWTPGELNLAACRA